MLTLKILWKELMNLKNIVLVFICILITSCDSRSNELRCVSSTPQGWTTWEEDNGRIVCWKSKGFQCAPKC